MLIIVGTTIGAGYASGREIWQFFGEGNNGAILIFSVLFCLALTITLSIASKKGTTHYAPILQAIVGVKIGRVYDVLMLLYLFTVTVVMLAGGSITLESFGVSPLLGVAIMAIMLLIVIKNGISGMAIMNALVVPMLLFILAMLLIHMTVGYPLQIDTLSLRELGQAFTFTSLNILPVIAVIGAVGNKLTTHDIYVTSIGSAGILGGMTLLYNHVLIKYAHEMVIYDIPLFALLKDVTPLLTIVMTVLLWGAIFTTAASGLFGLSARIKQFFRFSITKIAAILLLLMLPLSSIGFVTLVNVLYPIYGLLNVYLLLAILLYPLRIHYVGEEKDYV
ncbi:hypothetical protein FLK61_41725 [Paenalkalicoccus suaedae]|uniref:Membrane protein YkvI n=1 Tax=Paenalkalicoccus suaedae TaxID=2592382 RepID=A0A859FJZ8_9BACI|nr:hypothetical protein [Paenalkalicoccus suaedae]QKS73106.1 hypothetical protein FLK61_41725 [Paenalkalicoccus suaedae]